MTVLGYIGPGAGIAAAGTLLVTLTALFAVTVNVLIWPVRRLWKWLRLPKRGPAAVEKVETLDDLFRKSDAVTLHVPLVDATRGMVNRQRLDLLGGGAILINFARGAVVDIEAVIDALDSGKLQAYVCDFPTPELIRHPKVVALPHLGASTVEAEENCAIMVAENVRDYLENGNIRSSVNFPEAIMPRVDSYRVTIANANVPNMVGQISSALGAKGLNIEDLLNKSRGEIAYTVVDLDGPVPEDTLAALREIDGVLAVRDLGKPLS